MNIKFVGTILVLTLFFIFGFLYGYKHARLKYEIKPELNDSISINYKFK